jgi:DNA-binding LacI/PurR family transcriptional regulator
MRQAEEAITLVLVGPSMPARRSHPTQADVARRAGVSRALVGIVFRDQPGASQSKRDHIRAVAAEIGYVPDQRAQLLGRKRTGVLGVSFSLAHDFHSTVIEHLYRAADRFGFGLVLSGFGSTRPEQTAIETLLAYRCEGLVLLGSGCRARMLDHFAQKAPTVVAFRPIKRGDVGVVRTDDVAGSRAATDHLLGLGHCRLTHVDGGRSPGAADRRKGFRRSADSGGASYFELPGGSTEADGVRAGEQLVKHLGHRRSPTAAVVFNDHCAVGVIAALRRAEWRVPGDISVVGFDDNRLAGVPGVDLTTIRQDTAALADHAIQQLSLRIQDHRLPATQTVVAPELVVRLTTDRPRLASQAG